MRHPRSIAALLGVAALYGFAHNSAQASQIEGCAPPSASFPAAEERELVIETPDGRIRGTLAGPAASSWETLFDGGRGGKRPR